MLVSSQNDGRPSAWLPKTLNKMTSKNMRPSGKTHLAGLPEDCLRLIFSFVVSHRCICTVCKGWAHLHHHKYVRVDAGGWFCSELPSGETWQAIQRCGVQRLEVDIDRGVPTKAVVAFLGTLISPPAAVDSLRIERSCDDLRDMELLRSVGSLRELQRCTSLSLTFVVPMENALLQDLPLVYDESWFEAVPAPDEKGCVSPEEWLQMLQAVCAAGLQRFSLKLDSRELTEAVLPVLSAFAAHCPHSVAVEIGLREDVHGLNAMQELRDLWKSHHAIFGFLPVDDDDFTL